MKLIGQILPISSKEKNWIFEQSYWGRGVKGRNSTLGLHAKKEFNFQ